MFQNNSNGLKKHSDGKNGPLSPAGIDSLINVIAIVTIVILIMNVWKLWRNCVYDKNPSCMSHPITVAASN